jgi:hypothetical protein
MKELVFALEFKGKAEAVPGAENQLHARTSAPGQTFTAVLKRDGVQASIEGAGGDTATFESDVTLIGDGMFVETGKIRYGAAGAIAFKTVLRGIIGPSPQPGTQRGSVIWEVTSGEGKLQGAQGLITSNFTVGANGEVRDDQFARLYLP